jgi:hypothetical protein
MIEEQSSQFLWSSNHRIMTGRKHTKAPARLRLSSADKGSQLRCHRSVGTGDIGVGERNRGWAGKFYGC